MGVGPEGDALGVGVAAAALTEGVGDGVAAGALAEGVGVGVLNVRALT